MFIKKNFSFQNKRLLTAGLTFIVFFRSFLTGLNILMTTPFHGLLTDAYCANTYLFSLSRGFYPRSVMGTVWELASCFISWRSFVLITMLLFLTGITALAFIFYKYALTSASPIISAVAVFLFFSLPTTYIDINYPGLLDQFFKAAALLALYLIHIKKFAFVPLVVFAGIMIHDAFIFLCLPFIFSYALYQTDLCNRTSRRRMYFLFAGMVIALAGFTAARFNASRNNVQKIERTAAFYKIYTDKNITENLLKESELSDYGNVNASTLPLKAHWKLWKEELFGEKMLIFPFIVSIFTMLPALFCMFSFLHRYLNGIPDNNFASKIKKYCFVISVFPPIFLAFFTYDIARWLNCLLLMITAVWLLLSHQSGINYSRQRVIMLLLLAVLYSALKPGTPHHASLTCWEIGKYIRQIIKTKTLPQKTETDFLKYDE